MKAHDRIHSWLNRLGWQIRRYRPDDPCRDLPDLSREQHDIIRRVSGQTYTGPSRLATLLQAVEHLVRHRIPGDLVECGVWKGGSMMAAALQLRLLKEESRSLWLYDTFTGMTEPTGHDIDLCGREAAQLLQDPAHAEAVACAAGLAEVQRNLASTGYPSERVHCVAGPVEQTIPGTAPEQIALLRLDTDWYESTRHELVHLYPRLVPGGLLIIDDYGHWQGARRAVDEFLANQPAPLYLHRIDYTARCLVKPSP
jgi:O-methyltransferase